MYAIMDDLILDVQCLPPSLHKCLLPDFDSFMIFWSPLCNHLPC